MPGQRLREYQQKLVDQTTQRVLLARSAGAPVGVMVQLPTGAGKTVIGQTLLTDAISRDPERAHVWVTHRRELRAQSAGHLNAAGISTHIMADDPPGERVWKTGVVNLVSPALRSWPHIPIRPGLMIVDEAHHTPAATWSTLIQNWRTNAGIVVGLTATPWRLSIRQGYQIWYQHLVCGPSITELQDTGFLASPQVVAPPGAQIDTTDAKIMSTGDYSPGWIEQEVGMLLAHRPVLKYWSTTTAELPDPATMWYTPTVHCATQLADLIADTRIGAVSILTADTPAAERDAILTGLRLRTLTHLVSVDVIGEGIDLPAIPIVALLRPTRSLAVFLQQCGRAARPRGPDGGTYMVLDFAGNSQRHGVPDLDRAWSLAPRKPGVSGGGDIAESGCHTPNCRTAGVVMHPSTRQCWSCAADQYWICSECHVHRRWTNYPSAGKPCRLCTQSRRRLTRAETRELYAATSHQKRALSLNKIRPYQPNNQTRRFYKQPTLF